MFSPNTRAVPGEVVDLVFRRDGADEQLVRDPVSRIRPTLFVDSELALTALLVAPDPLPTSVSLALVNEREEPLH